jgi:hypothetical protein
VVSVDVGTESVRAGVFDASGRLLGSSSAPPHETTYPQPGWAEQSPDAWWAGMAAAVRGAIADARCDPASIRCLCLATTSCTVLALDAAGRPLRPALLWMDARSAAEAAEILALGTGDPALLVNCGGAGPLSAEWMLPKALWIKKKEPGVGCGGNHLRVPRLVRPGLFQDCTHQSLDPALWRMLGSKQRATAAGFSTAGTNKEKEPRVWAAAATICECQDW